MLLRELVIVEASTLAAAELKKYDFKYLRILRDLGNSKTPLEVVPGKREKYGNTVVLTPRSVEFLNNWFLDTTPLANTAPSSMEVYVTGPDGKRTAQVIQTSSLFKSGVFKGTEGQAQSGKTGKEYNAGHLTELFIGLAVSAKFFAAGAPITKQQVLDMFSHMDIFTHKKTIEFTTTRTIVYPDRNNKSDSLYFSANIPSGSAESFVRQYNERKLAEDLEAALSSAVLYSNESRSIKNACEKVYQDKNNNRIDVASDGTSDAKGTKADLTLKVDGEKLNLLSLKTFSSNTLGQFSGLSYENLSKWFRIGFNLDISPYKQQFDPALGEDQLEKNLIKFYDDIAYPFVQKTVEDQKPGVEAAIVKQFSDAANIYARGESLEDVEVVKLDDKVSNGSYKILKFSNNLKDAMLHFDLETRYVNKGTGRTIQIWVKPAAGEKVAKGSNRLCQFRTQKTGEYIRNYFESGPMLEALTAAEYNSQASVAPPGRTAMSTTSTNRELK